MRKQSLSCFKGNFFRKFPWGENWRKSGGKGLGKVYTEATCLCYRWNLFFHPEACVSKEILLRHVFQQSLLQGTWRVDGKCKNSI